MDRIAPSIDKTGRYINVESCYIHLWLVA